MAKATTTTKKTQPVKKVAKKAPATKKKTTVTKPKAKASPAKSKSPAAQTKKGGKIGLPDINPISGVRRISGLFASFPTGAHIQSNWGTSKLIAVAGGSTSAGTELCIYNNTGGNDQTWHPAVRGAYDYAKNDKATGKTLACIGTNNATIENDSNTGSQNFHLESTGTTLQFNWLRSSAGGGDYLTAQGTANNAKLKIEPFQTGPGDAQKFTFWDESLW